MMRGDCDGTDALERDAGYFPGELEPHVGRRVSVHYGKRLIVTGVLERGERCYRVVSDNDHAAFAALSRSWQYRVAEAGGATLLDREPKKE